MTTGLHTPEALTVGTMPGAIVPSFAPTLASLPVSFTPADPGSFPEVTVIQGSHDWPLQVADAIRSRSRGVIVSNPSITVAADVLAAADIAEKHGARVVLAEAFSGDPGLLAHQGDMVNHLAAVDTLSITHVSRHGSGDAQLLAVLRTARALGYPSIDVYSFVQTDHGFTAAGEATNGAVFAAVGARTSSNVTRQTIRGYGFARTVQIDLFGAETAAPARISVTNVDGQLLVPSVFETADRAAWLRLKSDLTTSDAEPSTALRDFATDLATVVRV